MIRSKVYELRKYSIVVSVAQAQRQLLSAKLRTTLAQTSLNRQEGMSFLVGQKTSRQRFRLILKESKGGSLNRVRSNYEIADYIAKLAQYCSHLNKQHVENDDNCVDDQSMESISMAPFDDQDADLAGSFSASIGSAGSAGGS